MYGKLDAADVATVLWESARFPAVLIGTVLLLAVLSAEMREHGIIVGRSAKLWTERPLLIVGSPGSGTGQMATSLQELGLNMEHETSRGRDGTVSWFHGMRLLAGRPNVHLLCQRPIPGTDWHPMQLEPHHCPAGCSGGNGCWNECWRKTCPMVLRHQHGCYRTMGERRRCTPAFRTTLLQVRHPLATIASCVRGFCEGGLPNATPNALVHKIRALVPATPPDPKASCASVFATFWYHYYSQAIDAADGWYRVEATTPCDVAKGAGLPVKCATDASSSVVFLPNRTRPDSKQSASRRFPKANLAHVHVEARAGVDVGASLAHGKSNRHNLDGFTIRYDDIARHHGGPRLASQLEALARRFGYEGGRVADGQRSVA